MVPSMQQGITWTYPDLIRIAGLVEERHNSIANALELRLSYTNPFIWFPHFLMDQNWGLF